MSGRHGWAALILALASLAAPPASADGPVEQQPFAWTGFYVGTHMGGLANLSDISDPLGPSMFGNPNLAVGPLAGFQAGYNHQMGIVVYGLEADVSFAEAEGTSTCSSLSGSFVTSSCQVGLDAFGTLTGRLGLAIDPDGRSLLYGKAGAAWSRGGIDIATNDASEGANGNPFRSGSGDLTRLGWTVGAGAEHALSGNWSVTAEYDFMRFGDQPVTLLPSAVLDATGAVTRTVGARQGTVSQELHLFKLGLNYRLGERVAPEQNASVAPSPHGFAFDVGGRYWYSWGRHKYDLGLLKGSPVPPYALVSRLTYDDLLAGTGEAVARIAAPWNLFAKGFIGGGSIDGAHLNDEDYVIPGDIPNTTIPYSNTLHAVSGDIPLYGTIDVGYDWWRAPGYRVGTYVGYNYYRESMDAYGCAQTVNAIGPCAPAVTGTIPATGHAIITQDATWQSLRLGAAAEFRLAHGLKLGADAAYLPYVAVDAVDHHFFGNTPEVASVNPLTGHGIGTQVEAMLSYDVTERLSLGVGARYWAMWTTDGAFVRTYDASGQVATPTPYQHLRLETERVGILAEASYKFE